MNSYQKIWEQWCNSRFEFKKKVWGENVSVDLNLNQKNKCTANCRFDFEQKTMGYKCNCRIEFIQKNMGVQVIVDLIINKKYGVSMQLYT